ncbi:MAG TPA: DUF2188 domain-containing protein [Bacteroidales bacterium]|nr:DUF2188 domain-containing protein [Bacteroidales bacterium]HPS71532.1 DUF2188 domain-containing protein [Bacteroidales bacterium]
MPRKEIHVVPNPDRGGWDSKRENAEKASKHFDTKKESILSMGRAILQKQLKILQNMEIVNNINSPKQIFISPKSYTKFVYYVV